MADRAWENFPVFSAVGSNFVLYEQLGNTEGRIARVDLDLEKGYVGFYAHGSPDYPTAGCALEWGSWRQDAEGIVVNIPMVGTLVISPK